MDEPDSEADSFATERTRLAWVRTGYAFIASGGLILHFSQGRLLAREVVIGVAVLALGILVWALSQLRFRLGKRAIAGDHPMLQIALGMVALAVSLAALGALLVALLAPS